MIECPACTHQEFVGTLFCSECGTRLINVSPMPTTTLAWERIESEPATTKQPVTESLELDAGAILGLRVVSSGQVISLKGRDNYTLGRSPRGQAVVPDVDLGPLEAYDLGISRLHAEIRLESDGVYVVDLESANGTMVNGRRLEPQVPHPVQHGDILQLGKLRLQLLSRFRA